MYFPEFESYPNNPVPALKKTVDSFHSFYRNLVETKGDVDIKKMKKENY